MHFTPFLVAALAFTSASAAVLEQRALLDICANIAGQLNIRLPILGLVSLGQVNICLCVSALPLYIRTDIVGRAVVKLLGSEVDALARLNALIGSLGGNCQYPTNAIPICSSTDPCGFQCGKGYVRQGSKCVCPANAVLCNGECKPAGTVCGSMGVAPRGISSWMDAQCKYGQEVCGVLSDGSTIVPHGFECIDTGSHKESCGGCVLPVFAKQTRGKDCTSITGTLDVSCIDSTCVVHTCKDGFVVSDDETTCLPVLSLESGVTAAGDTTAGGASVYASSLVSSGKAKSTFPNLFVARGDLSTSKLSLGAFKTDLTLDHNILATLDAADDPLQILLEVYAAAHAQPQSKREVNPTPTISSTVYPASEREGLVLVEGL